MQILLVDHVKFLSCFSLNFGHKRNFFFLYGRSRRVQKALSTCTEEMMGKLWHLVGGTRLPSHFQDNLARATKLDSKLESTIISILLLLVKNRPIDQKEEEEERMRGRRSRVKTDRRTKFLYESREKIFLQSVLTKHWKTFGLFSRIPKAHKSTTRA